MTNFFSRWGRVLLLLALPLLTQAQTGVGIGTTAPNASAALDIVSTNKGLLLPRVASAAALVTPATGLLVFQTGAPAGFYYNAGTVAMPAWQRLNTPADTWNLGGNTIGTTAKALGTLDNQDMPLVANGVEQGRFTNEGRLLLGLSGSTTYLRNNSGFFADGTTTRLLLASDTGDGDLTLLTGGGASFGPWLNFIKTRGTVAAPLVVAADDALGVINFWGYNGTGYVSPVFLHANVESIAGGVLRSYFRLDVADGEALRVLANRNVGIGIADPTQRLDVLGTFGLRNAAAWDHLYMFHDGTTAFMRAGGAETGLALQVGVSGAGTYGDASQAYRDVMRLLPSGNVGIGTTAPAAKLTVQVAADADQGLRVTDGTTTGNIVIQPLTGGNTGFSTINYNGYYGTAGETRFNTAKNRWRVGTDQRGISSDLFFIDTYDGNTLSIPLAITPAGNVGIGTTSPATKLDVNGNLRLAVRLCPVNQPTYTLTAADVAFSIFKLQSGNSVSTITLPDASAGQVEGQELTVINAVSTTSTINIINTANSGTVTLAGLGANGVHAVKYVWATYSTTGSGVWFRVQ